MEDVSKVVTPLSGNVRSDLVLLSSFLARQQHSPSQSHPRNNNLALVSCLSNLLTIGNDRNPKALNVNAVAGHFVETVTEAGTTDTLDYLVCAENGRQHAAMVESYAEDFRQTRNMSMQKNQKKNTKRKAVVQQSVEKHFFSDELLFSQEVFFSDNPSSSAEGRFLLDYPVFIEESSVVDEPFFAEEPFFEDEPICAEEPFFEQEPSFEEEPSLVEDSLVNEPFSADHITPDRANGNILLDGWNPADLKGSAINK